MDDNILFEPTIKSLISLSTEEINLMPNTVFVSNLGDFILSLSDKLNKHELAPLLQKIEGCSLSVKILAWNHFLNQHKLDLKNPDLATELRDNIHK